VALFMVVMLAFVALGVDGAKLMATRTQLQNAADAGALAGATAINATTGLVDQVRAVPLAQAATAKNKAFIGGPEPVLDAVVTFPSTSRVQVDVTRSGGTAIVTYLARVVGVRTLEASATAVAEAAPPNCAFGLRPLGVGNSTPPFTYVVGQEYDLISGFAPGNWQHLDFSRMNPPLDPPCSNGPCAGVGGSGGNLLRCMLEHGMGCCLPIGGMIGVQTGVSSGPVKQAVDYIFDNDAVQTEYPASQTNTYPTYKNAGGNGSRVVVVPLVVFIPSPCSGNNCWARVNGFAAFFLKRRYSPGQKTFIGEFVKYEVAGEGGGGTGTAYSVRLVR
jgi:hypothetical protein